MSNRSQQVNDVIEVQRELPTPVLLRLAYDRLSQSIYQRVIAAGFSDLRPAHGNAMESLSLERRGDPADRRAKRIYLTLKGQANAAAGRNTGRGSHTYPAPWL
jgi:hypothetical protein